MTAGTFTCPVKASSETAPPRYPMTIWPFFSTTFSKFGKKYRSAKSCSFSKDSSTPSGALNVISCPSPMLSRDSPSAASRIPSTVGPSTSLNFAGVG